MSLWLQSATIYLNIDVLKQQVHLYMHFTALQLKICEALDSTQLMLQKRDQTSKHANAAFKAILTEKLRKMLQ
jgi:hypothetical protein